MPSQQTIQTRIDEIDAILASGASSVTIDGVTISWDFQMLRTERAELTKQLTGGKPARQIAFGVRFPSC